MSKILLITVFCILGACLTKAGVTMEDAVQMHMKIVDECMAETGAKPSDLDDLVNEKPSSGMEGKCLRACLFKKVDAMDENGKMNRDMSLEHARHFTNDDADKMKIVTEILDACLSIDVSSNVCEAAEQYGNCYKSEGKARGIENLDF